MWSPLCNNNNNNSNNSSVAVHDAIVMTISFARVHFVHFMKVHCVPRMPLLCLAVILTLSEPTEDGRLSWRKHCSKGAQPMSKAVCHRECHGKHDCRCRDLILESATLQFVMLPLDNCDLQWSAATAFCHRQCTYRENIFRSQQTANIGLTAHLIVHWVKGEELWEPVM